MNQKKDRVGQKHIVEGQWESTMQRHRKIVLEWGITLPNYSIEPSLRCRLSLGSGGIWEEYIQCEAEKYWINNGKLDLFTSVFSQSWVAFKKVSLNCWMLHHKLPTSTIWPWGLTFKNISTSSCWFDLTFYLLNSPKVPCSEHKKDCG